MAQERQYHELKGRGFPQEAQALRVARIQPAPPIDIASPNPPSLGLARAKAGCGIHAEPGLLCAPRPREPFMT
jgi:hypothetical protein